MSIYNYEQAFGAADTTTKAMRQARSQWLQLYYGSKTAGEDPCQRLAYTIVTKLTKAVFGEYHATAQDPQAMAAVKALEKIHRESFGAALVEGESYLKPVPLAGGFGFSLVSRSNMLVFSRDADGEPTDIGMVEKSALDPYYYTLLERRTVDENGYLTIENRLYRSGAADRLGQQVSLASHPAYAKLADRYTYPEPVGSIGLARVKLPVVNCVDGSADGVSVYAAAAGLIHNIDRNEAQLCGEFDRGESRIIASRDLLGKEGLQDHVFVGLDEDPENVGITVFSPQLRASAFLERKQEYLRNVESIVGLRRGMLSDANVEDRTATEIASSTADFNLTVLELQQMWTKAVQQAAQLCAVLAKIYGLPAITDSRIAIDWGNGILYDEATQWGEYLQMVEKGLLKPEIALGWRFGMASDTPEEQALVRSRYMPANAIEN